MQDNGNAGLRDLPGGFGTGEATANDVDGECHASAYAAGRDGFPVTKASKMNELFINCK
jgi:hypothetical protein